MESTENRTEFRNRISILYLIAAFVVLPLYYDPRNGYYRMGDSKYFLYRNISLLCIGIWGILGIARIAMDGAAHRLRDRKNVWDIRSYQVTGMVVIYAFFAVLSALCSPYGKTAWNGETEWYMGALTICLMAGGYLLAADMDTVPSWFYGVTEAAIMAVTVLGLIQRLGYDPLKLLQGYIVGDWEYTHMISTLGNNNWLSGYYSVMLAFSLTYFLRVKHRAGKIILGVCNVGILLLLCLQGSDGGVLIAGIAVVSLLWISRREDRCFIPTLLHCAGLCAGMAVLGYFILHRGTIDILIQDGIARKLVRFPYWIPATAGCLIASGIYRGLPEKWKKRMRQLACYLVIACGVLAVIFFGMTLRGTSFAEWGNGRGRLWQLAWRGFAAGGIRQKLLGAGPDCFASYLNELVPGGTVIFTQGYFAGAVFTNAHNEWLTTLVNMGILGVAAYAGIFVTAFLRYRKGYLGRLLIVLYGIHSLISFQQVLNTPLFFLLLGLCEQEWKSVGVHLDDSGENTTEESTEVR